MAKEISRNIRLGALVIASMCLIIVALYLIGIKQNLFGSTFRITAKFHNVNGLMSGNNVRFSGINVGTVESVEIVDDSSVNVTMIIEENIRIFIKKNSLASVGTDGLMGNKLVNINSSKNHSQSVVDGDVLKTVSPIETEEMFRTLNATNDNLKYITGDLKNITNKINSPNTLWSLLMDTVVAENVKQAIVNIKLTGHRTAIITGDLSKIVQDIKSGKGTIGALLTDTIFSTKLNQTIVDIKVITDSMALVSGDLRSITQKIKNGEGAIGTLIMDTTFVNNLNKSMENIKNGTAGFDENMEALKHNLLLRKYFKKKEKENIPKE
ncbi:MAG: hypothetical protein A3F72_05355 [Bacteroidetes bacterium RIFCSPLOWO2_12_FULL_35_15]|nr:MAG: hypothetical protein A3F72_05355 [Bacteroidetes bacterium RIFCSPLOWO2_12_FULL_35_15]